MRPGDKRLTFQYVLNALKHPKTLLYYFDEKTKSWKKRTKAWLQTQKARRMLGRERADGLE